MNKYVKVLFISMFLLLNMNNFACAQMDSPWVKKAPYPYVNKDSLLIEKSYKEKWVGSSVGNFPQAVQKAKEVLKEWGQNPDKYEYNGNSYDYEIMVSESLDFISVIFVPVGLEGLEQHFEIRMTKDGFVVLSILPGA